MKLTPKQFARLAPRVSVVPSTAVIMNELQGEVQIALLPSSLDLITEEYLDTQVDFHWMWTGAKTPQVGFDKPVYYVQRSHGPRHYIGTRKYDSYALANVNGKRHTVHKLLWEHFNGKLERGQLRRFPHCSNSLCVNPMHWRPHQKKEEDSPIILNPATPHELDPDFQAPITGPTIEDCVELLEELLALEQPRSFAEVCQHNYMLDFPTEMVKTALHKVGKSHLTT